MAFSRRNLDFKNSKKERENKGAEILTPQKARTLEPMLSDKIFAYYYDPETEWPLPFQLNLALAESAFLNGVRFILLEVNRF